ncbi:MAG: hypothetical protein KIT20_13310 [Alphaproteobacteria bacterium]|nr:hypothetical protein [Alphaproteobacteria bacterium]
MSAALAGLLVACGPAPYWARPNTSTEQANRDQQECFQLAWREARSEAFFFNSFYGPFYGPPYYDRFGRRYYRAHPFGFHDTFYREQQLINFCMRARGYYLAYPSTEPVATAPVPMPPAPEFVPYPFGWVDSRPPERPSGPHAE